MICKFSTPIHENNDFTQLSFVVAHRMPWTTSYQQLITKVQLKSQLNASIRRPIRRYNIDIEKKVKNKERSC